MPALILYNKWGILCDELSLHFFLLLTEVLKTKTDFVLLACMIKPRFFMPNQLFPSLGGFVFCFFFKKLSDLTLLHQFRTAVTMTE